MAHAAIAFAKAARAAGDDGGDELDRAGRDQHGDGGGGRACQPPAGASAARRRLCQSPRPIRCCSRSRISATAPSRANDCFRPVSRYFDRITRPEQIMHALPRAMAVLTDPAECGPVTLALCQDVQAEAFDYPECFFAERVWQPRRPPPDATQLAQAVATCARPTAPLDRRRRRRTLCQAAGDACALRRRPTAFRWPKRRPGKGALAWRPSAQSRRDRRDRHERGQRRGGGRPIVDSRGGHAAAGFHDRLARSVPDPACRIDRPQYADLRCRQAPRAFRSSPTPKPGLRA